MFKKLLLIVPLALLISGGLSLFSVSADNSSDAIKIYEQERAEVVRLEPRFKPAEGSELSRENYPYAVYLGSGEEVKLSFLSSRMENPVVTRNLKWGEAFSGLSAGLLASVLTTLTLDITGASLLGVLGYYATTDQVKAYGYSDREWGLLTAGTVLFAISGLSLVGIITFAVLTARSFKHKMNIIQAQSIVNSYNNFLKKKLGLPLDMSLNMGYDNMQLAMSYKF